MSGNGNEVTIFVYLHLVIAVTGSDVESLAITLHIHLLEERRSYSCGRKRIKELSRVNFQIHPLCLFGSNEMNTK